MYVLLVTIGVLFDSVGVFFISDKLFLNPDKGFMPSDSIRFAKLMVRFRESKNIPLEGEMFFISMKGYLLLHRVNLVLKFFFV